MIDNGKMRAVKVRSVFLVYCFFCTAFFSSKLLAQDTVFNYNPLWTHYMYLDDMEDIHQLDTSISEIQRYHPAEAPFGYLHIGQLGAPETPMFFSASHSAGFDIGFHQFDLYWMNSNEVKFYDTKRPYTVAYYQQGSKNEIKGAFTHTQNILPQWSIGVELNRYRTDGFYLRQVSKITNFDAFTRYASKNGFYHADAGYVLNSLKVNENGGVADLNVLIDTSIFDKSLVMVRLDSADQHWKNDNVFLLNSFDFGSWEDVKKNDSVTQRTVRTKIRFQHLIEWERRGYYFKDAAIDNDFYENIYLDSLLTRDTLKYDRLSNEVAVLFPVSEKPLIKDFTGKLFVHHDLYSIQSKLPDQQIQNGILGFDLNTSIGLDSLRKNQIHVNVNGQYNFIDYNNADYSLRARAAYQATAYGLIRFEISQSRNHPSLIQQNYLSNHFQWANSFTPSLTSSAKVYFMEERWKFIVSGELFRVNDHIYWNQSALPAQYHGTLNGFTIFLEKNFQFKSFHFDNELQYQHFNTDTVVTFPEFFSRHSLYFEDKVFKGALTSKIGIDVHYTANYYGPAYMPETGQFYVQRSGQLTYYPVADIFFSIKVKGVRAFILFQNINKDLFASTYFSAYRYPMPDRSFKLGLEWRFWN